MTAVFTAVEQTPGGKCFITRGFSFGAVAYSSQNGCFLGFDPQNNTRR